MWRVRDIAIQITADLIGLCSTAPHNVGVRTLEKAFVKLEHKKISREGHMQITEFVLKKYFCAINQIKLPISGTVIGAKFASPCAKFLETQRDKQLHLVTYIGIWTHAREKLNFFQMILQISH